MVLNLGRNHIKETHFESVLFSETLRKYPVVTILNRECTKNYKIPDTNVVVEKGTPIIVPVLAMHRDARYFPEPEKFIPERFQPDNSKSFEEAPYLPFGDGPRNCMLVGSKISFSDGNKEFCLLFYRGLRMGKMQTKVGLVLMLQHFTYDLVNKDELKFSPKSFVMQAISGINLKITKRIK